MMKYKIIETTVGYLKDIEVPFDFSENVTGDTIEIFGLRMLITQAGSSVVGLSSSDHIIVMKKVQD